MFQKSFRLIEQEVVGKAKFRPPFKMANSLDNAALFVHVVNGHCRIHAPVKTVELQTGESLIMKCDNFVNHWLPNADQSLTEVVLFQFRPDTLQHIYNQQVPDFVGQPTAVEASSLKKVAPNAQISRFAQDMAHYIDHPELMQDELLKVKVRELVFLLTQVDHDGSIVKLLGALFNRNGYPFKHIVEANIFENLNLEDLAFMAGMSLSSFQRRFKEHYGTTPRKYINSQRLERAKSLLKRSDIRINEVAFDCGFQDVAYFSNAFTSAFAMSPSAYRKAHLE